MDTGLGTGRALAKGCEKSSDHVNQHLAPGDKQLEVRGVLFDQKFVRLVEQNSHSGRCSVPRAS